MSAELSTAADPERAAVLVMLLAEEDATGLLARLSPEELRLLGSKMYSLGEIGPGAIADAIASGWTSCGKSLKTSLTRPVSMYSFFRRGYVSFQNCRQKGH